MTIKRKRTMATGFVGALVGAVVGASIGWYVPGLATRDEGFDAIVGFPVGGLIGFGLAGPARSWVLVISAAAGSVIGGVAGGWLTQDEGLGAVIGMLFGAIVGLIAGIAAAVPFIATRAPARRPPRR